MERLQAAVIHDPVDIVIVLEGSIPSPANPPSGCKFHTRCANCMAKCKEVAPQQKEIEPGHYVVCHLYDDV